MVAVVSRQTDSHRGPGEAAPFYYASEGAHGVETIHCSTHRIMLPDYAQLSATRKGAYRCRRRLSRPDGGWINGQVLPANGGMV
jgi:hypothetical protein